MEIDNLPVLTSLLAAVDAVKPPLETDMRLRLSLMNFLQFAVWGAWFVVLGQYLNTLKFTGRQIGSVYATMSLGSIISPMIVGGIADRYFASEYVMAGSHVVGAVLLFVLARIRTPGAFYIVALAYALVYSPTLAVSNAVIFANIPDATRDFPTIRVLGTIGWIAANLFLKVLLKPGEPVNNRPLLLASGLSALLGFASLWLPHTPPKDEADAFPFVQALQLLGEKSFAVFFGVSFLITIALAFYYSFTSLFLEQRVGVKPGNVGPLMTIGQWMEIFFLLGIPTGIYFGQNLAVPNGISLGQNLQLTTDFGLSWFLQQFGMKTVLLLGMAAWGLRYAIFAIGRPFPLVILGLALHGLCFDFFFAAGFIHVENTAPAAIRNSGQALFGTLTYGLGMYLGTEASGWIHQICTKEIVDPATGLTSRSTNWTKFWFWPCLGVLLSLALFVALF
ncbi:MAG: MFS transporter [Planctomycetaceae bacterium]